MNKNIDFKFSYLALKLLGKNLYSNAWAALSELVANGIDAKANSVYVYVDMRDKRHSKIEVFDDGEGMSYEELRDNYVHIGRNRRLSQENSDNVMGRKGIGKLAALYLSRHYYVATKKHLKETYIYEMDFTQEKEDLNNEHPEMRYLDKLEYENDVFSKFNNGTMIKIEDVDLKGYAEVSVDSLNNVLSDFFAINSLNEKSILLKVVTSDDEINMPFKKVEKKTPFRNMVKIVCFDEETYKKINNDITDNVYKIPYKKYVEKSYSDITKVTLEKIEEHSYTIPEKNEEDMESFENEKNGKITGWIGIHSSIQTNIAIKNDINFKKNKLYNPLKLRVYVRNKLAIDNFLPVINNTQVFVNFIEGEISYDILDDNDFPDIATTSRQNMDENDGRIIDLANDVKKEITKLIRERQFVSKEINEKENKLNQESNTTAKDALANTIDKTIEKINSYNEYSSTDKEKVLKYTNEIKSSVLKNVQGELLKKKYKIFFSHSRENKSIIDFFFYLLKNRGIHENEMFYTSKDNRPEIEVKKSLADISKENIIDNNTMIFFYSTKDFLKSEYCMFEGGAAWATRTQEDFFIIFDQFENVPTYLNPGNEFLVNLTKDSNILTGSLYNHIIQTLNFMINHINVGRSINHETLIATFEEVDFPDIVESNKGVKPILDQTLIEYWNTYVGEKF